MPFRWSSPKPGMDRNRAVYHQFVERRGSTAKSPPSDINACLSPKEATEPRPVKVDLFIATYSEDTELVRLSIQDALKMDYPFPIDYRIHVLDDGRRPDMKAVCEEEGVNYISRQTNIGFKAGNLRNGLEQTDGDFIVICDADTRVFPTLLSHTLGYFRDPDVAGYRPPMVLRPP